MERLREKAAIYEPRREAGNGPSPTSLSSSQPGLRLDGALRASGAVRKSASVV